MAEFTNLQLTKYGEEYLGRALVEPINFTTAIVKLSTQVVDPVDIPTLTAFNTVSNVFPVTQTQLNKSTNTLVISSRFNNLDIKSNITINTIGLFIDSNGIEKLIAATTATEPLIVRKFNKTANFYNLKLSLNISSDSNTPIIITDGNFASFDDINQLENEVITQLAHTNQRFEENPNPSIGKGTKDTKPVITFITDDARRQDMTIFKDMFQRVGLPVSTAVTPYRSINTPSYGNVYLTVDEIRTLQDDFGWEIVSHTWNHERLTEISDEELDFTLKESRDWLRDNGFKGYEYLMYPFGAYDERVKRYTAKYYRAARTTSVLWGSAINEFPVASYQLSTRFFSQTVSLDILKADVDRLIESGGWLNLFFHSWEIDSWNREADFEELLNYVKEKQDSGLLDVMGYKDTYERYGNVIDQTSYVDRDDEMFIMQSNGNVRSNIAKTKKLANNSVTVDSLPNDFPANFLSFVNITQEDKGFPTKNGTLETMYFTTNENEPTTRAYARQTFYPYASKVTYSRTFGANAWMNWISSADSGTSGGLEIITGSAVDGDTAPSDFPQNQITVYSKGSGTSGLPTTIGGLLSVYKVTGSFGFWYQEFKQVSSNNSWRRFATSNSAWSDWVKTFPPT